MRGGKNKDKASTQQKEECWPYTKRDKCDDFVMKKGKKDKRRVNGQKRKYCSPQTKKIKT